MKKFLILVTLALFFLCKPAISQKDSTTQLRITAFMEKYFQYSRLGPGYTREMTDEYMTRFKTLFELDAFIFWDLYQTTDSVLPPRSPDEYIANAIALYAPRQPVLNYGVPKVILNNDGQSAVVFVVKNNILVDSSDQPVKKQTFRLMFRINIHTSGMKIQGIEEDKRNARIRSAFLAAGYTAYDNTGTLLAGKPASAIVPALVADYSCTVDPVFFAGVGIDIRLNKNKFDWILIESGFSFSRTLLTFNLDQFSNKYRAILDTNSNNKFECTVSEQSATISEKITLNNFMLPVSIKGYVASWLYLRGGVNLTYTTGTTTVTSLYSKTGGGILTNLVTGQSRSLLPGEELTDSQWGFFLPKENNFSIVPELQKVTVSVVLAAGFEKKFNRWSIGIEPSFSVGQNPLWHETIADTYDLNSPDSFTSFLTTLEIPRYSINGNIAVRVGYLFK